VGASSAERSGKSELGESPDTSVAGRSLPVVLLASGEAAAGAPNTPLGPVAAGARELTSGPGARELCGRWSGELVEPDDERGWLSEPDAFDPPRA
jgi:hypothetical protein